MEGADWGVAGEGGLRLRLELGEGGGGGRLGGRREVVGGAAGTGPAAAMNAMRDAAAVAVRS